MARREELSAALYPLVGGGARPGPFRRFVPTLLVSALVLCVECVLGAIAVIVRRGTEESTGLIPGFGFVILLPVLLILGVIVVALISAVVSVALVLPVLALAGRARWWQVPLADAVIAALPTAAVGLWGGGATASLLVWLLGTAALTAPGLAARPAAFRDQPVGTGRALAQVAMYGTLAVVLTVGGSVAATRFGWIDVYEPPELSRQEAAGTWTDGEGGTLRLAPDGTVTATHVRGDRTYGETGEDLPERCSADGEWELEGGDAWTRRVLVTFGEDCGMREWSVGGTEGHESLYAFVGDPDEGELYRLEREWRGSREAAG